jgi:beta-glucosidase-like glycosyl hydrolase
MNLLLASLLLVSDLSLEEKVGQLLMTSVFPEAAPDELDSYLDTFAPGHLLFVGNGWDPEVEQRRVARYQAKSRLPLTIAQDLEWGLAMRLNDVVVFPKNGALAKAELVDIEAMGEEIARECRILGVNLNLAPVVDVNNNPLNPIIKDRSFGSDPYEVAARGAAYMRGLKKGGIKSCAKHFPGHGNTDTDSHKSLPIIPLTYTELKSLELIPFKHLIDEGVDCVLTAHLALPLIDPQALSASLSPFVIQEILQKDLGFRGVVLTDDLLMQAIPLSYGEAAIQAFLAGNDILLFTNHSGGLARVRQALREAHRALVTAVLSGRISKTELDARVEKILSFKATLFQGQEEGELITEQALQLSEKLRTRPL